MLPNSNTQVLLKSRPEGIPQAQHFEIVQCPMPSLGDGDILVRNEYLSVDPAMRGWVNAVGNYSKPVGIGEVMRSLAAGEVVASRNANFAEGDTVSGFLGWQHYAVADGKSVTRVPRNGMPLSLSLGVLGLNGATAYFALLEVGRPRAGDTVVVSTAAGAVGSAVGQIAKIAGCRTVGIAGGAAKTRLCLEEFGYDAAIDYKSGGSLAEALAAACPNGVNVYFDNTAGAISDAVYSQFAIGARAVVCGTASVANWDPIPTGPRVERHLLVKRASISGFLYFDYQHRIDEAVTRLAQWIREGRLRYREDITDGIETCPGAIAELYRGENLGKRLVRLHSS